MNKIITSAMAVAFAAFMSMNAYAFQAAQNDMRNQPPAYGDHQDKAKMDEIKKSDADVRHLIGKDVKDQQGNKIGDVKDFLTDPNGRISLAIVKEGGFLGAGGKEVGVPFSALSFNKDKDWFTTNLTKDKLAGAPEFKRDAKLNEQDYAKQVYGYYGMKWEDQSKAG